MFALDAWQRGDTELMLSYLEPIEEDLARVRAAGAEGVGIHIGLATIAYMKGDTDLAFEHLERGMSLGVMTPGFLRRTFAAMDWDDLPRFAEIRDQHEIFIAEERAKFLRVACGPDGFSTWQPSDSTCAEVDTI
jgi:hypothetical protein